MNTSKGLLAVGLLFFALVSREMGAQSLVNPATEKKIDDLLAQMTLDEKVGQLNQYSSPFDMTGPPPGAGAQKTAYEQIRAGFVGSMLNVTGVEATRKAQQLAVENSRLKIPLIFGYDVVHGYKTVFPIPLGEAASWDRAAVERSARVAATEAAAAGLHWTFAPMVDIARDARWGRIMEGSGEDPFLGAQMAAARVRGFQGPSLAAVDTIAACAKHYAAYGFAEAGRDYNTVDISESTLRNVVLPPFKAAADAGAATFMNSFNEIGGIPATASVHLQREILKGEWGFKGFVVSDWGSIAEMVRHGYSEDLAQAAQQAITAGSDMDMEGRAYIGHLAGLVRSGRVDVKLVDEAVRRVLRVKFALGLFDDPYRYSDADREKAATLTPANLEAARDVARRSIVLLKNDGVLPLDKTIRSIAVIGPLANDKDTPLGNWRGKGAADSAVSLLEGVKAAVSPGTRVIYAEGAKLVTGTRDFMTPSVYNTTDRSGFAAAVDAARQADVALLAVGEDAYQSGEGRSQAQLGLAGLQDELVQAVAEANKNVVVVLMSGRPLTIGQVAERVPALLETWLLGSQAGHAIADVLFGDYNPSGKLPVSFPRVVGQEPLYYGHKSTGRPGPEPGVTWSHYTDVSNDPLYPFGFGLSYTTFTYSDLRLSAAVIDQGGELKVSVTVTNSGRRTGSEIVQLYVRDMVGSVTRPVKELKGFERVELGPGQSSDVTFTIRPADLAFYTARGRWEAEPGAFRVFVGGNSRDLKEASFTLVSGEVAKPQAAPHPVSGGWRLVFSDEFSGNGALDPGKWGYEIGYIRNHEAQYYTSRSENVRVEAGNLVVEGRKEAYQGHAYTSASVNTLGRFEFLYGRVEVRAKLPTGNGAWPAVWMLGTNRTQVGWPACGEIDIMENVGFDPLAIHASVHTAAYNHTIGTQKTAVITVAKPWEGFHVYAMEWYPDRIDIFVDGQKYFTFRNEGGGSSTWPFDKPQYLLINLAIGGSWGGQKGIDDGLFPKRFLVDYVRVYQQR